MRSTINTNNAAFKAQFARVMRLSDELLDAETFYNNAPDREIAGSIIAKKAQEIANELGKLQEIGQGEQL